MAPTPDLAHFLQRRDLLAYEQRLARSVYAYGVDLRRATQLYNSRIGDPLMRGVDRRWNATKQLLDAVLLPTREAPPPIILEELARLIRLLRAPLPAVRMLRADLDKRWPMATPLGTTRGGAHWLVLDTERLMDATPAERSYVLGWALGHLQCDHGPLFAAHLMAGQANRSLGVAGWVLKPWARLATFSADRAAMIAVGGLDAALEGLPFTEELDVPWLPAGPSLSVRRRALEDFAGSSVMARLRVLTEAGHPEWTLGSPRPAATGAMAERLSHVFGTAARFGYSAAWMLSGGTDGRDTRQDDKDGSDKESAAKESAAKESSAKESDSDSADASPKPKTPPPQAQDPVQQDPELRARLESALEDATSVARCDENLTRRLGLL